MCFFLTGNLDVNTQENTLVRNLHLLHRISLIILEILSPMAIPVCSTTYSEKIALGIQTEDKEVAQIALVGV